MLTGMGSRRRNEKIPNEIRVYSRVLVILLWAVQIFSGAIQYEGNLLADLKLFVRKGDFRMK